MHKTWTRLEPALGLIFKTETRPYCLAGRVRLDSLGWGWVKYLRVGLYLRSLLKDGLAVGIFLLLITDNYLYYHEQTCNFSTTFLRGRLLLTVYHI